MTQKFSDLIDMQKKSIKQHAHRDLFGTKKNGVWHWITYRKFGEQVDAIRGGLAAQGISQGDVVAIIAGNRVEWAVTAYATYGLGAMFVPMYENQLPKDWEYILKDSGAKLLLVSSKDIFDQLSQFAEKIEPLQKIFCIDLPKDDKRSYANLESVGKKNPADTIEIDPESVCGFIYTSGTTGNPKGVLLSHKNITSNINAAHEIFPLVPDDCSLSFLPWAHSFGQTVELHTMLSLGAHVGFAESIPKLIENLSEVRPTVLVAVPRIFNKIYDGLKKKMAEQGGVKKILFNLAIENETRRNALSDGNRLKQLHDIGHLVFDKVVFSKVRDRFGGRLKYAFSGGAALSPEVAHFIDKIGIMVYEGYGLTETSPIACANYRGNRKIGTVGKPIPGVTIKVDTAVVDDGSGDGEIIVIGPNVMQGYHNLPDETTRVMTAEGGFRTGDRGNMDKDGYVRITGRIKEQYKLENGKYVVPAPLEERLQLSPYILQVFIDGANQGYNVALIVPAQEAMQKWAKQQNLSGSYSDLLQHPKAKALIEEELNQFSADFKSYEKIRQFALIPDEFTIENGLLTPSMKLKRRIVNERYGDLLASLWG